MRRGRNKMEAEGPGAPRGFQDPNGAQCCASKLPSPARPLVQVNELWYGSVGGSSLVHFLKEINDKYFACFRTRN